MTTGKSDTTAPTPVAIEPPLAHRAPHGDAVNQQAVADSLMVDPSHFPRFEELSEDYPEERVPWLDRSDTDESALTPEQRFWRENGYLILPGVIPEAIVDAYLDLRERTGVGTAQWGNFTPYMFFEEIRDLCCHKSVADMLCALIGEKMGMHFNLASFKSTQRAWHQDDYLNPPDIYSWYAACWFSLGDIHPDSGPFEFVPGSHRWPCMRSNKVKRHLQPQLREVTGTKFGETHWASHAEIFTTPAYEQKLAETGAEVHRFLGNKGDVLIWHGKLLHRGSTPKDPGLERPAIITHYSSIERRTDIGTHIEQHGNDGWYWSFPQNKLMFGADAVNMDRQVQTIAGQQQRIRRLEERLAALGASPDR